MIRGILLSALLLCLPAWGQAATYYLNDTGSNANAGTSTGAPWLTWAHAFSNSVCGDTLVVMDGTYTPAKNGNPVLTKTCTASTVYTVRAQNQRVALISGTGAADSFKVLNSAYIVIDGLRIKSADLSEASGGKAVEAVDVTDSHHITLKNLLVYENNRYFNTHLIFLNRTENSLVEDTELYSFHRHGLIVYYSDFNIVRRLYCHSRWRADIAGGWVSAPSDGGDDCIAVYPASDNTIENVIAENVLALVSVQATALSRRNQVLGSIALNAQTGASLDARGDTAMQQPQDTTFRNFVVVNSTRNGVASKSALNTQIINATAINAALDGFLAQKIAATGGGSYSFFCTNCLAMSNNRSGFTVTSDIQTWTINYSSSFGNGYNYNSDVTHANIKNEISETTNPGLGTCYLWLPDASPLKRAGLGGADIGANILYRYQNGVLTNVPLWNPTTGKFPHGALVAGVNDVAGISLFDVHKRLNVNTNGCSFPANYGNGVTDGNAPASPRNLTVF